MESARNAYHQTKYSHDGHNWVRCKFQFLQRAGVQSRRGRVSGCDGQQEVGTGPEVAEQIKRPPRLWREHRKRTVGPEMGRRGRVHALVPIAPKMDEV